MVREHLSPKFLRSRYGVFEVAVSPARIPFAFFDHDHSIQVLFRFVENASVTRCSTGRFILSVLELRNDSEIGLSIVQSVSVDVVNFRIVGRVHQKTV